MKKKIFYWSPFFSNIATIKAVLNSAISVNKFSKNNSKPILINAIGEWDEFEKIIVENNIEVVDLKLRKYFKKKKINGFFLSRYYQIKIFFLAFIPLYNILKKNKSSIFILHLVTSLPLFINFFFNTGAKVILRISGLPRLNFFRKLFWQIVIKKVDTITTPTIATRNYLKKMFKKQKICLLRDPIIFVKEILRKNNKNQKNNNLGFNVYVSIGRLTKQKNFIFLLECFKKIIEKNNNNYLYILGNGEDFRKLEKFVDENNLKKNIFLEGYKKNIYEYLNKSKAFILPSLWEDPGFVLIEAAYANTLIISSNCNNGPKEIIEDNQNGFLFKSNDKSDFLRIFEGLEQVPEKDLYKKKLNAKKMSRNFSLFNHYIELHKILINV